MSPNMYLTYITKPIRLPHCTYVSHCHYVKWVYSPYIFAYIYQNTTNCTAASHIIPKYVTETNMPFNCQMYQLLCVQMLDNYASIYALYELTKIKCITKSTGINTFNIRGTSPGQICLPYCTYIFCCISTIVYI